MKKLELEIEQDESPMNPRIEWDNVSTMICFHNRYNLGDNTDYKSSDFNSWDELKEQIESDYKVLMIKPLYLYDHSGITISTSSFNDRWDSGQVGWVFIEEKQWVRMMGEDMDRSEERLEKCIDGEVETYDQYLTGDVYSYSLYEINTCSLGHEHKVLLESCGGYYGEEYCKEEGERLLEYYQKQIEEVTKEG